MNPLRPKSMRRGLAPLEFVLALPLLLFVMALFINAGASSAWKVRAQGAARDAIWRDHWPRRFEKPQPADWPQDDASIRTSTVDSVPQLEHQDIDQPVARGPSLGSAQVNRDLLDPTRGGRRGHSSIQRQRPLLPKVGGDMKFDLDHALLDRTWTYDHTNLDPEMPQPYKNDGRSGGSINDANSGHTAYEEHHGQVYEHIKQGLNGNFLRRIPFIYDFGPHRVQGEAEYKRAVSATESLVGAVQPLSFRLSPWEGATRYGDPDFKRFFYEFGPIWDMVEMNSVSSSTSYRQPFPLERPYYPFSIYPNPDALDGYPEFHPQLRSFCSADQTEAEEQARENVDELVKTIKGDKTRFPPRKPAPDKIAETYLNFYRSVIAVHEAELLVLQHNNDPRASAKQRVVDDIKAELEPKIQELQEFRNQL